MFSLPTVLAAVTAYMALLVMIALLVERSGRGRAGGLGTSRWVYALSQAVFCTTWTFYGSVGLARRSGLLFLAVYLAPTLAFGSWWIVARKLVRLKSALRLTSLGDFLAARYGKSQGVGALATVMVIIGLIPYIALQLKTMHTTVALMTGYGNPALGYREVGNTVGPLLALMMIAFTIAFGLRRISPSERHPGMMVAICFECVVKLIAVLAAGVFATFVLFHGPGDLFAQAQRADAVPPALDGGEGGIPYATWLAYLLISGPAILLLPRQFHTAVVENSDERHLRTAMWAVPLYLLAVNLFVVPIAMAGGVLLEGAPGDTYVLALPLSAGVRWLSMLVFLGGFSAGAGMITIEVMAIATMVSNQVVLPLLGLSPRLAVLRRRVLWTRWAAAALIVATAFVYERAFGRFHELVSIGMISFAAVFQFAPATLGGLFWRRASKGGAVLGMAGGFAVWMYTMIVPEFVRVGWLSATVLTEGPWGIGLLRPEQLLGLSGLDPIAHAVVWTLVVNLTLFLAGSLFLPADDRELREAERFVAPPRPAPVRAALAGEPVAEVASKQAQIEEVLRTWFEPPEAHAAAEATVHAVAEPGSEQLSLSQLGALEREVERTLAASIGTAAAHAALRRASLLTEDESRELSRAYAQELAELKIPPSELRERIDFHAERERLLAREAASNRLLAEVSRRLSASLDYEATLRAIVAIGSEMLADGCALAVRPGGPGAETRMRVLVSTREGRREPRELTLEPGQAPRLEVAWKEAKPALTQPDAAHQWPQALSEQIFVGCSLTVPLLARQGVIGVLALIGTPHSVLGCPDDLGLAQEIARRCAIALENAALYRSAQEAVQARDEFLAIASHELRTPLTPLSLQVQMLQRLMSRQELVALPPERLAALLKSAQDQINRLSGLVANLLDVSRVTTGRLRLALEEVDLSAVVTEVVERYRSLMAAAECEVRLRVEPGLWGRWDRLRIEQVVTNLLDNARKYAPGKPVEVVTDGQGPFARLLVRDRGAGVAPEDQQRIFQPFERAVPYLRAGGFGLGLYIVRQIIEAHGGSIALESRVGEGSTFTVLLPRELAARAGPGRAAPEPAPGP